MLVKMMHLFPFLQHLGTEFCLSVYKSQNDTVSRNRQMDGPFKQTIHFLCLRCRDVFTSRIVEFYLYPIDLYHKIRSMRIADE